jgi:hypothetical protein
MPDLENSTPGNGNAATPSTTEPAPGTGTVQPNGEAGNGQGAPGSESFTRIDPSTLPPELRHAYDNMLRDYKEGTTKLSERIKSETTKAVEAYKQKAESYDQLAAQEEFVKMWNEHVQKANTSQTQNKNPETAQLEKKLQEMEVKIHQREASEILEAFENAVDEKGEKLHPHFSRFNEMAVGNHPELGEYSLLRAAVELAPGKDHQEKLANGYKAVEALYNSVFEEGKKAGMGRVQEKLKNGTHPPSSVNAASTAPRRPKDALEALQFARQGLAVSKD